MSKTLSDLRTLKRQYSELMTRYDRTGDKAVEKQVDELQKEIESFPPHLLREDATSDYIKALEEYLVGRIISLQPDVDAAHIQSLNASGTRAITVDRVVYWRDKLRGWGMSDEDFEIALMMAYDLNSYRPKPIKPKSPSAVAPTDYKVRLKSHLKKYLELRQEKSTLSKLLEFVAKKDGGGLDEFIAEVRQWSENPYQFREGAVDQEPLHKLQMTICGHLALLKRLGISQEEIDEVVRQSWS